MQEWQTKSWQLEDVQRCWSELIADAHRWPQRVAGPGGHAYVISADIYKRFFIGFTFDDGDGRDEEPE